METDYEKRARSDFDALRIASSGVKKSISKALDHTEVLYLLYHSKSAAPRPHVVLFPDADDPRNSLNLASNYGSETAPGRLDELFTTSDLYELGPALSVIHLVELTEKIEEVLGGVQVVNQITDVKGSFCLAVRAVGVEVSSVVLAESAVHPTSDYFAGNEAMVDVVWKPSFGVPIEKAVAAFTRVQSAGAMEYGSVFAEITGSPIEWARSFLGGEVSA